ncbi:MAG: hypothetical protein QXU82_02040 [Candidatus Aenigmatarchaeota archaeon]
MTCYVKLVVNIKCDICKILLTETNIGFVSRPLKGKRVQVCRRCHNHSKKRNRDRKLSDSWTLV